MVVDGFRLGSASDDVRKEEEKEEKDDEEEEDNDDEEDVIELRKPYSHKEISLHQVHELDSQIPQVAEEEKPENFIPS